MSKKNPITFYSLIFLPTIFTGLKTVVNALPNATDMVVVQSAVREAISPLLHMVMSHQDDNVRVEACEVLAEIINQYVIY